MNLHRLRTASEPAFDALARIYTESFPASERKSMDTLLRMIARPEYVFLAALDAGAVVGFAIAIAFIDSDAALFEYMAVDAERRGTGIGEWLFRATATQPEFSSRYLLGEVEAESVNDPDAALRALRKQFYSRLGVRWIEGLAYRMPQVSSAEPPPMDMFLYRDALPDAIEKARLRRWLEACYTQVYGVSADDPRISEMLSGLPERIRLI